VIDAHEEREVAVIDIPNAFIQADYDQDETQVMKIRGELAILFCEIDPTYKDYITYEGKNNQPVIYVVVTKAIYGMIESALLWYKKFRKDLESQGFEVNPYDLCVFNKMVDGK
jgi:hypothetical protein